MVKASIMVVSKLQSTSQIISNQLIVLLEAFKPPNETYGGMTLVIMMHSIKTIGGVLYVMVQSYTCQSNI